MKLTTPFSVVKDSISDLKRVPKKKEKDKGININEFEMDQHPFDRVLFYCYNVWR